MAMIQLNRSIGSGDGCDSSKDSSQIRDRAIGTRTITSGVGELGVGEFETGEDICQTGVRPMAHNFSALIRHEN